jgi:hypothetical protein
MSSDLNFVEYVCDRIDEAGQISFKKRCWLRTKFHVSRFWQSRCGSCWRDRSKISELSNPCATIKLPWIVTTISSPRCCAVGRSRPASLKTCATAPIQAQYRGRPGKRPT